MQAGQGSRRCRELMAEFGTAPLENVERLLQRRRPQTVGDGVDQTRQLALDLRQLASRPVTGDIRAGALKAYAESLEILRRLAAPDPGNASWARNVSVSLNKVGDVRVAEGDRAGALQAFEESLDIRRRLAAADPGNADWARDLIVSNVKLAGVADNRAMVRKHYAAALAIAEDLAKRGRLAPADAWMIDDLQARLAAVHGQ